MLEPALKLAVATKDGISINEHFGHAKKFGIYSVSDNTCQLLKTRNVDNYCLGEHADQSAMAGILETIKDCHAVFVARIGDGPTAKVNAIGVRAVAEYAYATVEESLLDYARRTAASEEIG